MKATAHFKVPLAKSKHGWVDDFRTAVSVYPVTLDLQITP